MSHHESGKVRLIKGSLRYVWEELKTLNLVKIKALFKIISGYIKMKYFESRAKDHAKKNDFSLDGR